LLRTFRIILIIAVPSFPAWALTSVPQQDIDKDTHWTRNGSPYIIYGDLTIRNGAVLTIDAGVEVRFAKVSGDGGYEDGAELVVRSGSLVASGRKGLPVIFTAHTSNPEPGYWGGIIVEYSNLCVLKHTNIKYAIKGLRFHNLSSTGASISSTEYLEISNCSECGIYVENGYADIYHAILRDNEGAGIETDYGFCNVAVNWSDIYDNGLYNFENHSSSNVNATDCWWGTTVEALIEMRIYDKNDNPAVGEVDYTPYLSGSFKDVGSTPQYSWGTIKSLFFSDHGNGPG
jgi:hypothetical protein